MSAVSHRYCHERDIVVDRLMSLYWRTCKYFYPHAGTGESPSQLNLTVHSLLGESWKYFKFVCFSFLLLMYIVFN